MINPVNIATAVATALVALALAAPALSTPDVPPPTDLEGPAIPTEEAGTPPWAPGPEVSPGTPEVLPPGGVPAGEFSVEPTVAVLGWPDPPPDQPVRVYGVAPTTTKAKPITRAARCARLRRVGAGPRWIKAARCPVSGRRS